MKKGTSQKDMIPIKEAIPLFFSSLKRLWRFDKKYVVFSFLYYVLGIVPVLLSVFVTSIFNQRIIMGTEKYAHYWQVFYPLILSFLVMGMYGVLGSVSRYFDEKCKDKITAYILRKSSAKAARIDFASYDDPKFYDAIQKGWSEDGSMLIDNANIVFETVRDVSGIVGYTSILAYIDWKLMLFIVILRICINPIVNKVNGINYRLNNRLAEERRKEQYFRNFFDAKEKAAEGKVFGLFEYAKRNYQESHGKIYKATFVHKMKVNAVNLLAYAIYSLPLSVGYIYLSVCVYNKTVSLANMAMFVSLYVGFVDQVYNTLNGLSSIRVYAERSRYAREFQAIKSNIYTENDHLKEKVSAPFEGHTVEFCNVSFRYPGTEKNVLENINFIVHGNETVSIIGANGAGKTTLVHLLMRLYDPTDGVILLDGKDLRNYSAESLYTIFGVLFQDYCNYAISAKESITLSAESISEDRLTYALGASTADKFIDTLEDGIDTPLSKLYASDGVELSVGQKQRIALARAYYKEAQVLILDEPSASIDPEAEANIYDAVNEQRGKKCIWLITHRLSTCVLSDRILLFKNGALIGNGTHCELLNSNTEYKRMFRLQAERYEVSS